MLSRLLPRRKSSMAALACLISLFLLLFFHTASKQTLRSPLPASSTDTASTPDDISTSTMMSSSSSSSSSSPSIIPVTIPDPFTFHKPTAEEKYLTYLPHSGFHNQRIELENALLLAFYLNRTLLVPDVYLGNPAMPWLRFDKMYERLLLQTKRGLDHCPLIPAGAPYPMECLNYDRWTKVPWTFFFDLKPLTSQVRIVLRPDLSLQWLQSNLNINHKRDIHLLKDVSPYEFRVYDHKLSKTSLSKFMHRYDVDTLEAMNAKLLHFGSVFGTHRVLAQQASHAAWLKQIRTHLIFRNPVLVDTAEKVVDQLGGVGSFVGLHLRVGDGLFKVRASINIDDIYHSLVNQFTDLNLEELQLLDSGHDDDRKERTDYEVKTLRKVTNVTSALPLSVDHTGYEEEIASRWLGNMPPSSLASRLSCQKPPANHSNVDVSRFSRLIVYIATDAPNPRQHPLLRKIYNTFPCVFDLGDFGFVFDTLRQVHVVEEKVQLDDYLIPMLDAIIAAQGHHFFGTKDSTFTSYIERQLHPVYTHKEVKLSGPPVIR